MEEFLNEAAFHRKRPSPEYCVAFVKKITHILLVYRAVAIATQFLYYTLIDTGTHNGSLS